MTKGPVSKWSETDHSGPIIIFTVLAVVYWLLPGVVHQVVSLYRTVALPWADRLFSVSMLFGLAQTVVVLVAASHGLGKSQTVISDSDADVALRTFHASNALYILVLAFAKASASCAVLSITVPDRISLQTAARKHKIILCIILATTTAWILGSIVALSLTCKTTHATNGGHGDCGGTVSSWAAVFAVDALTDISIAAFAGSIIWPTQAPLRLKIAWLTPYLLRLSTVAVAGCRFGSFYIQHTRSDQTLSCWLFVVLTQSQLFLSLTASGFPTMKRTVLAMSTNFGVSEDNSQNRSHKQSYAMASLSKKSRSGYRRSNRQASSSVAYTGESEGNVVEVSAQGGQVRGDDDSQKGILRQDDFEIAIEESHGTP